MTLRLRFPGGEVVAFPDGTSRLYIENLLNDYEKFGGFEAMNQRTRLHNLRDDPEFLALPRIERQRRFNEEARSTGAYWDQIAPPERRTLRELITGDDEANEQETESHWDSPFVRSGTDIWDALEKVGVIAGVASNLPTQKAATTVAEYGRALERSNSKTAAFFTRAAGIAIENGAGFLANSPTVAGATGIGYTNPLFQTKTGGYLANKGTEVGDAAREMATDLSVGSELMAPPPRVGEFGDVHGWDDFTMYVAQALGTQTPIMGSIVGAGLLPGGIAGAAALAGVGGAGTAAVAGGIGTGLVFAAGAGLETGSISEDLARAGFEGPEADIIAATYGVMAGALEAMPIANLLKRVPIVRDTFKKALVARVMSGGRQALEEAGTEGIQTLVEQTAVDIAHAEKGELEKVSWLTPEGIEQNISQVIESMIQGALIGGIMGGAGPGNIQQAEGVPGDQPLAVPEFEPMPPIEQGVAPIEGPSGPAAPVGEDLLPPAGGPEGPTIPPEVRNNARWNAAPLWLEGNDRLAWAQGQEIDLERIIEGRADVTLEDAIVQLEQAAEEAETFLSGGMEQPDQEDLSVLPEDEAAVEPGMVPIEEPGPLPAAPEGAVPATEAQPSAPLEGLVAPGGIEQPVQPTQADLDEIGAPVPVGEEAEIDRIAAKEEEGQAGIEPAGAVPAPIAPVTGEAAPAITFKPKQASRIQQTKNTSEYPKAVAAVLTQNEGKLLTGDEVQEKLMEMTGFGKAGIRIARVNDAIEEFVKLGVVEKVDGAYRVLPGRIDPDGFAINEAGMRYGIEVARAQAEYANENIEAEREEHERQYEFLKEMKGLVQVYERHPKTGKWFVPDENRDILPYFRAPKPTAAPVSGTKARAKSVEVHTDQVRESAIERGLLTDLSTVDDAVALLSKTGKGNMGLGPKPQMARPKDFRQESLEKPTETKLPTVQDIRRTFRGWGVRQTKPGRFQVTRKGQPVLQVNFTAPKVHSEASIQRMAKAYKMDPDEVRARLAAGTAVVKGSYTFYEATGAHIISLVAPHATPDTLYHESFHFAFHNVLEEKQRQAILKEYGTEEKAAKAYQQLAEKHFEGEKKLTVAERALKAIYDFARAFSESLGITPETAAGVMKKIATGDVYELQKGKKYTVTGDQGATALYSIENAILSAEEAQKEAEKAAKLAENELTDALKQAKKNPPGFGKVPKVIADELSPVERIADPDTFYSLEIADDTEHPAAMLPDETLTEHIRERGKRFLFQKIAPIVHVQEKLTEFGEQLNEAMDGFLKAQNFSARSGALLDWLENNLFVPFTDQLAAEGVSFSDFDLFRMAAHALERNPKIFAGHVTIPKQILQKKIDALEDKGLSEGMKVRALDRGNIGTIKVIDKEAKIADVYFHNPETGLRATVSMPLDQLKNEALATAEEKVAAIDKMVADDNVPHSGIEDDHAKEILNEMRDLTGSVTFDGEAGPNTTYGGSMGRISKRFSKIVRWKENTLFKAGLLSKEELKKWRDYKHYSPMRGKDPDILDVIAGGRRLPIEAIEMYGGKMWHRALARTARSFGLDKEVTKRLGTGRGYNPGRRPAAHRALGRRSFPQHSATLELITDTMEAAVRGEKNRVAKAVWNFAQRFKNATDAKGEKLFEINRPSKRMIYDEKTGAIKEVADGLSVTKDNVYNVWIDGKLYYIRHISPEMAPFVSALNNIGPANIPAFLRGFTFVNREMSKLFTSRNPAFAIPNAFRDAITAGIKLAGEKQFEGFGLKTMTKWGSSWAILKEYARRESRDTLDKMDQEKRSRVEAFKLAGGETSFWIIPDLERQMKMLQKNLTKAKKAGKEATALVVVKQIIPFIEDYNGAIENTMRFSVYERALEMNISKDKAARLARNITVDFTQQGTVAKALTPFYIFANASLQGSKMVYDSVTKNPKARAIVGSMVPMAMTWAFAARIAGGDDPEDGIPYYDKISAYEKSRNIIIMIPGTKGKRAKIPLPWGFNVAWMLGSTMADVIVGAVPPADAAARIVASGMGAFNPIGDNDLSTLLGWQQMVVPSWYDPINDVASNKTFWGGPIRPEKRFYKKSEQYGEEAPNYNNTFSSVSKPSQDFTKFLYKHTSIDVNPENIDYLAAGYFGGLGDLINRSISLAMSLPKRRAMPAAHEMPIVKSFYGDEGTFFAPQMYRANMADHYLRWETYKDLEKTNKSAAAEFYRRHVETLRFHKMVQATEKRVRLLKDQDVKINDSRMQKLFKQFNRRYNTLEKKTLRRRIKER